MAEKKRQQSKSNTWTIIITIIILLLVGLAIYTYISQAPQFSPTDGCGETQVRCNGACQNGGLTCSECLAQDPYTPFKNANGDCTSSPTNIGN